MTDQTDRRLAARFEAIANRNDDSDWQTIVERASQRETNERPSTTAPRVKRFRVLPAAGLITAVVLVCAVTIVVFERSRSDNPPDKSAGATTKHHPPASLHSGVRTHPTPVATLVAFTSAQNTVAASDLPASVAEVVRGMGADPGSGQVPFKGPPAVYLFRRGTNNLCIVEALSHATGSCFYVLAAAGGAISDPSLTIVDGKEFVDGLAANDVQQITATNEATDQTSSTTNTAAIENNVFVVSLPYNGGGVGAVTVTVTRTNGKTFTLTFPGVPAPLP